MTNRLAWGVLMLVSFSKPSISDDLNGQINEGIKKINATEKLVRETAEETNREINKISLYFSHAVNESLVEGQRNYKISAQKVEKIIIANFEKGIDKDVDIGVLLYLLEVRLTTENELDGGYGILESSLKKALAQKSNELEKVRNLFEFTEKFYTGFYDGLRVYMKNCKNTECIKQLVQAAETKRKILTNIFRKYVKEMSKISAGLRDGHRQCIRDAQKKFSEVLKKCENDLEYIPGAHGTDDLTDRFDFVILE